jgi:hypothetical protein
VGAVNFLKVEDVHLGEEFVKEVKLLSKVVGFEGKEGAGIPSSSTKGAEKGVTARSIGSVKHPTVLPSWP